MASQVMANGPSDSGKYIDTLDPDDPEYQRQLLRPVEVREDVRQMEERRRVQRVLTSRAFCDELQELVLEQLQPAGGGGPGAGSVSVLQRSEASVAPARSALLKRGVGPCIPVADVRELDAMDCERHERQFRCKLASLYRLVDLFGWSHGIQSYITGRITQEFEHFLVAPYGLLHHEVTASNLVKVDMRGDVLDPGSTALGVNKTGFSLHSAVYASRPDIKCLVHVRCTPAVSVSALNVGLLPLCQESMAVGDVSCFEYSGGFLDMDQRDKLRRAIGPINKVFVLRNFGLLVGGETIEEAFCLVRNVMTGVDTQLKQIAAGGLDKLVLPSDEERRRAHDAANQGTVGADGRKWRQGEQEFEALMKHLDNHGYRTGYLYRDQEEKKQEKGVGGGNSDVAVPPTVTSYVYSYEGETNNRVTSPVKGRSSSQAGKVPAGKGHKSDWIGYPEPSGGGAKLDDTNTLDTTRASKWAPEETSTPIKPEGARKEHRQMERQFESTMTEASRSEEPLAASLGERQVVSKTLQASPETQAPAKQPSSPQKSVSSNEDILHDRQPSPDRSGRETPGSKDKKKKKWSFGGSKKKEKQ